MKFLENKTTCGETSDLFSVRWFIFHVKICVRKTFKNMLKRDQVKKKSETNTNIVNTLLQFEEVKKLRGPDSESIGRKFESYRAHPLLNELTSVRP